MDVLLFYLQSPSLLAMIDDTLSVDEFEKFVASSGNRKPATTIPYDKMNDEQANKVDYLCSEYLFSPVVARQAVSTLGVQAHICK